MPPEIYIPLVDSLFKDGRTLLAGTIFVTGSIFITYWKTGEPLLLGCALAILLVAGARGLLVRAYGRVRSKVMSAKAARRWEYRYVAGAAASLALLGMWCFLTLALTSDPFAVLVSFSMTIAYATGIFGRNFGSARFVVVQIFCAWAPMTAALLLYGNHYHWIFAGMLVPSFFGMKFVAERLRRTLLDAVIASRDMTLLATRFDTALNKHAARPVHVRRRAPYRRVEPEAQSAARTGAGFRAERLQHAPAGGKRRRRRPAIRRQRD